MNYFVGHNVYFTNLRSLQWSCPQRVVTEKYSFWMRQCLSSQYGELYHFEMDFADDIIASFDQRIGYDYDMERCQTIEEQWYATSQPTSLLAGAL